MNNKRRGATAEREVARILRDQGYEEARRSQQYCGINGDADVVGVSGLHIEVKRRKAIGVWSFLEQAERDCRQGDIPIVFMRPDRDTRWAVMLRQEAFNEIWQCLTEEQKSRIRDGLKMRVNDT